MKVYEALGLDVEFLTQKESADTQKNFARVSASLKQKPKAPPPEHRQIHAPTRYRHEWAMKLPIGAPKETKVYSPCVPHRPQSPDPRQNHSARLRAGYSRTDHRPHARELAEVDKDNEVPAGWVYHYHQFYAKEGVPFADYDSAKAQKRRQMDTDSDSPRSPRGTQGRKARGTAATARYGFAPAVKWTNGRVTYNSAIDVILSGASHKALSDFTTVYRRPFQRGKGPTYGGGVPMAAKDPDDFAFTLSSSSAAATSPMHMTVNGKAVPLTHPHMQYTGHSSGISSALLLHNDTMVATGSHDGSIRVFVLANGDCEAVLLHHKDRVGHLAWHEGRLISGSDDNSIVIWGVNGIEFEPLHVMHHKSWVVCLTTISIYVASGGYENMVYLWNSQGQLVNTLEGHIQHISVLCAHENILISGSLDSTMRIWFVNAAEHRLMHTFRGHKSGIAALMHVHSTMFVSICGDGLVKMFDALKGQPIAAVDANIDIISSSATFPHENIVCGAYDGTVRAWNMHNNLMVTNIKSVLFESMLDRGQATCFMALPSHNAVLAGTSKGDIVAMSATNGDPLFCLKGHTGSVTVMMMATPTRVLSMSEDRTLCLFELPPPPQSKAEATTPSHSSTASVVAAK